MPIISITPSVGQYHFMRFHRRPGEDSVWLEMELGRVSFAPPRLTHVWGEEAGAGWSRAKTPIFPGFAHGVTAHRPKKCSDNSIWTILVISQIFALIPQNPS